MKRDDYELLTLEFPDDAIAVRPEIWCATCKAGVWRCDEHPVEPCATCGQQISAAHTHVQYIPHIYIRERLDDVDRNWNWRPMGRDEAGYPAMDGGSLWIYLTVKDKCVIGVGDAGSEVGGRGRRAAVSNAIRNAAEALGVGRYLRMRESERPPVQSPPELPVRPASEDPGQAAELRGKILAKGKRKGMSPAAVEAEFKAWSGMNLHDASVARLTQFFAVFERGTA